MGRFTTNVPADLPQGLVFYSQAKAESGGGAIKSIFVEGGDAEVRYRHINSTIVFPGYVEATQDQALSEMQVILAVLKHSES